MDHLVTINNNSSEDENTNDWATSASTASTVSTSGRDKKKFMKKLAHSMQKKKLRIF